MASSTIMLDLSDEAASQRLGADLARALRPGDFLALTGDLGAGKSTLARAIIRALAGEDELEVPSPTFTLVQTYETPLPAAHFDLYRLSDAGELDELGLDEALAEGVAIVEWPQIARERFPAALVEIDLAETGNGRSARILAHGPAAARIARTLAIRDFLERSGRPEVARAHLTGDASARAYEIVSAPGEASLVLMDAPRQPDGPPIRDGKPYSRIAHLAESVEPFIAIGTALRSAGFAAPRIHAADPEQGLLLLEHLGSQTVLDTEGRPVTERYLESARLLARLHDLDWPATIEAPFVGAYDVPPYDRAALGIETELLTDWYLPFASGAAASDEDIADYRAAWAKLFDTLESAEKSLVLRDYHSPNLIWRPGEEGIARVGVIDFQDALIGPAAYDVASLAMDARVTIAPELELRIVDAYCAARTRPGFDSAGFAAAYAIMAAQRNSKILGIFVRLDRRDGKPAYLRHLPRIRDYLARALRHPALGELAALYSRLAIVDGKA
jgi:N-acetylmuramate 1-kinase